MFGDQLYSRLYHEREAQVIYLLTSDRQTMIYYSTIHTLELIYFDSNTQETRAGVYEILCPQHMLVPKDNLETRLLYYTALLYKMPKSKKGDNSVKYLQNSVIS